VAESKKNSFVYAVQGVMYLLVLGEDEDSFHYSIRGSTTKGKHSEIKQRQSF
jgi:hypothetical protein